MFDFFPGGDSIGADLSEGLGCFVHAVLLFVATLVVIALTKWW